MKRKLAIAFAVFVLAIVAATYFTLRSSWAARKLCALAERRVAEMTGLPFQLEACEIEPLLLQIRAEGVRLGPAEAPVFAADSVRVRLAPVQAVGRRLHLSEVEAVRPRVAVTIPERPAGAGPAACPPAALAQLEVQRIQVEEGTLDLGLPGGGRVLVGRFDVHTAARTGGEALRQIATAARRSRVEVDLGPTLVEAAGRQVLVAEGRLDADLALDFSRLEVREGRLEVEGVKLSARGEVANLCQPRLGLDLAAEAPLPALFALLGQSDVQSAGSVSAAVRLGGTAERPAVSGEVRFRQARINQYHPGDARLGFRLAGSEVRVERIEVPFAAGGAITGQATVRLGRQVGIDADVKLDGVEFADLLDRLGLSDAHVMMRLGARIKVSGAGRPFQLSGDLALEAREFRVLDHPWKGYRPGEPAVLELARARVDSPVRIDAEGVDLLGAAVSAGDGSLRAQGRLHFRDAGGFQVALEGAADLSELRHVAAVPVGGRAEISGSVRAVPYGTPSVEARVKASAFRLLQLDLGQLEAAVHFDRSLVLRVAEGAGQKGATRYQAELDVNLGARPVRLEGGRLTARGRLRDLCDVVLPWLPAARRVREAIDAQAVVTGALSGPVDRLDAAFDARLGPGELWGRAFESGLAQGRIERSERVVFDRAELRRGAGHAEASGWIGLQDPSPWQLEIALAGVDLSAMDLPAGRWGGTASGSLTLSGSAEEPVLRFAASGESVAVGRLPVGSVQVGGALERGTLRLTGTTPGVRFSGEAQTRGDMPFRAQAELDVEDVTRFVPGGPPAGLRAQVKGEASAEGALSDLSRARARVRLSELRVGYGDFKVDSREPIAVAVDQGRVQVESFTLQGVNTEFTLEGARDADGSLDFTAGGSLDLRLLGGLVPAVTRARGQLAVDAKVAGSDAEPLLLGTGRIQDGGFRLRELPIEFSELGGELSFSQNRVVFEGLSAKVNGARAAIDGEIELTRFVPNRIRAEVQAEGIPLAIPSSIPSTVSGRLSADGSPDAMTLSGTLHVLRARYTQPFDLEGRLLEIGRRQPQPKPYDKSQEWLRFDVHIVVDGDARIENDLARAAVGGELTLTGTLAGYGMLGALAVKPGARATFRGNEFYLSRGVLTFNDRNRVSANLDVFGEATVRDFQVAMHLTGTLDAPQLALTSTPSLSQQDIVTLLSLGYTTRDVSAGPSLGAAATAVATQALFTASGLDRQIERFLPKSGVVQDFSVRVTSVYSPTSMQIEPRLEFETKTLDRRLRLRYLAPVGGGVGQKAQVEYRFNERTSLQGQWDTDNPDSVTGSDLGLDLKLRWEWTD
ncbi:MAG TPA: translocation/assembly module TamB domain-containing protein [Anaeromyxobacteraceae bacterium]|nr:translocation/assembly module TamB domain-containing protein [Anaeromyxobacteraceae bacterium]